MSFRSRLSLFFVIIVVIPMAAVAIVLFRITGDSETGKTDSRIAGGLRTAFTLYEDATIRSELRRARRGSPEVVRATYYGLGGREVATALEAVGLSE